MKDWRRVVLYISALGMEACWLYGIWLLLDTHTAAGRLSLPAMMLLYPVAFGANVLLERLKWRPFIIRSLSWLLWAVFTLLLVKLQFFSGLPWSDTDWLTAIPESIAGIFFGFRPELLVLVGGAVVWWLARRMSRVRLRFSILVGEFQFGLVALLGILFVASQIDIDISRSFPIVIVFFFLGLTGIPVAHSLESESWLSGLSRGQWSGLLLVSIGLIIILGLVISWIVTPDFLQLIVAGFKWLWGVAMKVIAFIVSLLPKPGPGELPPETPMPPMGAASDNTSETLRIPEWLRSGLQTGWSLLMAGIVILALWRISSAVLGWMRRRLSAAAGAEFEQVPTSLRSDLLNLLKRMWGSFFRFTNLFHLGRKTATMPPEVAPVRQVYRQLLRWADKCGCARGASQTPLEYLPVLADRVPDVRRDLVYITRQYMSARYGTSLPDEDIIRQIRESWQRVRKSRLKKENAS